MKHVLSTHLFVNSRLTTAALERVQTTGIPAIEIFCARQHLDWRNKAQVAELGHWFRDSRLELWSLHSPMYTDDVWGRTGPDSVLTITESTKWKRIAVVDEIKRAIEVAEIVPFKYLVQHLGVGGDEYDERKLDAAFSSLEELSIFARQRGVEILLENIPNQLSSSERLHLFLEQTHLNLNFCFDIGHANIEESVESAYNSMRDRIRSTHLHDNDGSKDAHLFPFGENGGTIDWHRAVRMLASRPEQYPLLLELKEDASVTNPLETAARIFDRFEELASKPVEEEEEERVR